MTGPKVKNPDLEGTLDAPISHERKKRSSQSVFSRWKTITAAALISLNVNVMNINEGMSNEVYARNVPRASVTMGNQKVVQADEVKLQDAAKNAADALSDLLRLGGGRSPGEHQSLMDRYSSALQDAMNVRPLNDPLFISAFGATFDSAIRANKRLNDLFLALKQSPKYHDVTPGDLFVIAYSCFEKLKDGKDTQEFGSLFSDLIRSNLPSKPVLVPVRLATKVPVVPDAVASKFFNSLDPDLYPAKIEGNEAAAVERLFGLKLTDNNAIRFLENLEIAYSKVPDKSAFIKWLNKIKASPSELDSLSASLSRGGPGDKEPYEIFVSRFTDWKKSLVEKKHETPDEVKASYHIMNGTLVDVDKKSEAGVKGGLQKAKATGINFTDAFDEDPGSVTLDDIDKRLTYVARKISALNWAIEDKKSEAERADAEGAHSLAAQRRTEIAAMEKEIASLTAEINGFKDWVGKFNLGDLIDNYVTHNQAEELKKLQSVTGSPIGIFSKSDAMRAYRTNTLQRLDLMWADLNNNSIDRVSLTAIFDSLRQQLLLIEHIQVSGWKRQWGEQVAANLDLLQKAIASGKVDANTKRAFDALRNGFSSMTSRYIRSLEDFEPISDLMMSVLVLGGTLRAVKISYDALGSKKDVPLPDVLLEKRIPENHPELQTLCRVFLMRIDAVSSQMLKEMGTVSEPGESAKDTLARQTRLAQRSDFVEIVKKYEKQAFSEASINVGQTLMTTYYAPSSQQSAAPPPGQATMATPLPLDQYSQSVEQKQLEAVATLSPHIAVALANYAEAAAAFRGNELERTAIRDGILKLNWVDPSLVPQYLSTAAFLARICENDATLFYNMLGLLNSSTFAYIQAFVKNQSIYSLSAPDMKIAAAHLSAAFAEIMKIDPASVSDFERLALIGEFIYPPPTISPSPNYLLRRQPYWHGLGISQQGISARAILTPLPEYVPVAQLAGGVVPGTAMGGNLYFPQAGVVNPGAFFQNKIVTYGATFLTRAQLYIDPSLIAPPVSQFMPGTDIWTPSPDLLAKKIMQAFLPARPIEPAGELAGQAYTIGGMAPSNLSVGTVGALANLIFDKGGFAAAGSYDIAADRLFLGTAASTLALSSDSAKIQAAIQSVVVGVQKDPALINAFAESLMTFYDPSNPANLLLSYSQQEGNSTSTTTMLASAIGRDFFFKVAGGESNALPDLSNFFSAYLDLDPAKFTVAGNVEETPLGAKGGGGLVAFDVGRAAFLLHYQDVPGGSSYAPAGSDYQLWTAAGGYTSFQSDHEKIVWELGLPGESLSIDKVGDFTIQDAILKRRSRMTKDGTTTQNEFTFGVGAGDAPTGAMGRGGVFYKEIVRQKTGREYRWGIGPYYESMASNIEALRFTQQATFTKYLVQNLHRIGLLAYYGNRDKAAAWTFGILGNLQAQFTATPSASGGTDYAFDAFKGRLIGYVAGAKDILGKDKVRLRIDLARYQNLDVVVDTFNSVLASSGNNPAAVQQFVTDFNNNRFGNYNAFFDQYSFALQYNDDLTADGYFLTAENTDSKGNPANFGLQSLQTGSASILYKPHDSSYFLKGFATFPNLYPGNTDIGPLLGVVGIGGGSPFIGRFVLSRIAMDLGLVFANEQSIQSGQQNSWALKAGLVQGEIKLYDGTVENCRQYRHLVSIYRDISDLMVYGGAEPKLYISTVKSLLLPSNQKNLNDKYYSQTPEGRLLKALADSHLPIEDVDPRQIEVWTGAQFKGFRDVVADWFTKEKALIDTALAANLQIYLAGMGIIFKDRVIGDIAILSKYADMFTAYIVGGMRYGTVPPYSSPPLQLSSDNYLIGVHEGTTPSYFQGLTGFEVKANNLALGGVFGVREETSIRKFGFSGAAYAEVKTSLRGQPTAFTLTFSGTTVDPMSYSNPLVNAYPAYPLGYAILGSVKVGQQRPVPFPTMFGPGTPVGGGIPSPGAPAEEAKDETERLVQALDQASKGALASITPKYLFASRLINDADGKQLRADAASNLTDAISKWASMTSNRKYFDDKKWKEDYHTALRYIKAGGAKTDDGVELLARMDGVKDIAIVKKLSSDLLARERAATELRGAIAIWQMTAISQSYFQDKEYKSWRDSFNRAIGYLSSWKGDGLADAIEILSGLGPFSAIENRQ